MSMFDIIILHSLVESEHCPRVIPNAVTRGVCVSECVCHP